MLATVISFCTKLVYAALILIIGNVIIKTAMNKIDENGLLDKIEVTIRKFVFNCIRTGLYVLLFLGVLSVLGISTASVIAVIASAGLAIGMALQGSLSNLAGGVMLMLFRPFRVNDYVTVGGVTGTVKEITIFYTTVLTPDNKRISVPNGGLMNTSVISYTAEDVRRVDLSFVCGNADAPEKVETLALDIVKANDKVMADPVPAVLFNGGAGDTYEYTVHAWCKAEDYSAVHYALTRSLTNGLKAAELTAPLVKISPDR